ncbi:MAG: hypothetical protein JSW66_14430 [Phycisphaerales bacterium]|nr:MAG: hypothetical protein JSW66_14430 [Phycisphaerales bacterium]
MGELGRISGTANGGAEATYPTRNGILRSAKAAPAKVPDDDAAAATIRNAHRPEVSGTSQNIGFAKRAPTRVEMIRDFLKGVEAKVAKLIELVKEVGSGSFSYQNLQQEAEALGAALANRWKQVPAAFSQAQLDSGSPFSVAPSSSYSKAAAVMEFRLDRILEIERSLAERRALSQVDAFSLARVRERALKALRCQQNLEPERVLFLLQNDVLEPNTNDR